MVVRLVHVPAGAVNFTVTIITAGHKGGGRGGGECLRVASVGPANPGSSVGVNRSWTWRAMRLNYPGPYSEEGQRPGIYWYVSATAGVKAW